jgi:hypothetical protein
MSLKEQEVAALRMHLRMGGASRSPSAGTHGEPELLTVREAAVLANKSVKAVYAQAARGNLPGVVRYGRTLRIRRNALLHSDSERRVPPGRNRR